MLPIGSDRYATATGSAQAAESANEAREKAQSSGNGLTKLMVAGFTAAVIGGTNISGEAKTQILSSVATDLVTDGQAKATGTLMMNQMQSNALARQSANPAQVATVQETRAAIATTAPVSSPALAGNTCPPGTRWLVGLDVGPKGGACADALTTKYYLERKAQEQAQADNKKSTPVITYSCKSREFFDTLLFQPSLTAVTDQKSLMANDGTHLTVAQACTQTQQKAAQFVASVGSGTGGFGTSYVQNVGACSLMKGEDRVGMYVNLVTPSARPCDASNSGISK